MTSKNTLIIENYPINPGPRNEWEGSDETYEAGLIAFRRHVLGEKDMRSLRILQTPGHKIVTLEELDLARYTGAELC